MNSPIQIIGVLVLLVLFFKFKRLRFIYLSVLIISNFFGFVSDEFWSITSLNFKWFYVSIFFVIGIIHNHLRYSISKVKSKEFDLLNRLIQIFFLIQIVSLFFTLIKGNSIKSLIPFFEFIPYIFIIPLATIFCNVSDDELKKLKKIILYNSVINCIIFILLRFDVLYFYDLNASFLGSNKNLVRSIEGWPIFLFYIFPIFYLKLLQSNNFKLTSAIFLFLSVVIITYTRSLLISFVLMIIFANLLSNVFKIKLLIRFLSVSLIMYVFLNFQFKENIEAFSLRFTSDKDLQTIDYRLLATSERFQLTFNQSPIFGLGFIYKEDAESLNLKFKSTSLFFPDFFWPNLFSSVGILGSIIFFYILYMLTIIFFRKRNIFEAKVYLVYFVAVMSTTFASGQILFRLSPVFVLITAVSLASVLLEKRKISLQAVSKLKI